MEIVTRLKDGEAAATSTCHLSEVLNILEAGLGLQDSLGFLGWALSRESFKILEVSREDYEASLSIAQDHEIGANDALAYMLMTRHGLNEIYTFDGHFNQFNDIQKLP
jgi:predicted nucleic acid-binding protein